jgi:hypothetical protein
MAKRRVPLQVSPDFELKLKNLQRNIMMKQGCKKSLRDLTEEIIRNPLFEDIENKMLQNPSFDINLKLKFDKRLL